MSLKRMLKLVLLITLCQNISAFAQEVESRVLSFEEAHALSAQENKFLFVMISTTWCGVCKMFKQGLIQTEGFERMLKEKNMYFAIMDVTKKSTYYKDLQKALNDPQGPPVTMRELAASRKQDFIQNIYYNSPLLRQSYPKFFMIKPKTVRKLNSKDSGQIQVITQNDVIQVNVFMALEIEAQNVGYKLQDIMDNYKE